MRDQTGNATLEFIGVSVFLAIPLLYAMLAMGQLQSAIDGVNGAAQMAARAYATASTDTLGRYAAVRSAGIAGRNHGLLITTNQVTISCGTPNCMHSGAVVRVAITSPLRITLGPFAKTWMLKASQTTMIDQYRATP